LWRLEVRPVPLRGNLTGSLHISRTRWATSQVSDSVQRGRLIFTFDPAASPSPWPFGGTTTACNNTASYFTNPYTAHLALGGTTYTLGSQGIFEVLDPLSNQCSSTLVQFIYAGQPFPFLQVSTHFAFAAAGVLPDSPTGGIELFAQLGRFEGQGQLEGFGNLQAVSTLVPEPTPLFLIAPLLAIGWRRIMMRTRDKAL
jgi:hypothetical protein